MPDLTPAPKNLLEQSVALQTGADTLSRLEAIALSDNSYFQRVRRYAALRFREHLIRDLIYSAIIGPGIAGLAALINGDVTTNTFVIGVVGVFAIFLAFFIKYVIEAPSEIDNILRTHLTRRQNDLLTEKARNAKPELIGVIECLEVDLHPNVRDEDYDCFLTFSLTMRNNSAAATMVSRFDLELLWGDESYVSIDEPLDGLNVETRSRQRDELGTVFEPRLVPLTAFPYDKEITNSNYVRGWLRFSVGSMPPATVKSNSLLEEIKLKLVAFDSRREPHLIYEGTTRMAGCGKILTREDFFFDNA
jgi:TM2 domain-containing membrane protein YozV